MTTNKKRFVTVFNIDNKEHYIIDCLDTSLCFKVAQKYHKLGEHHYKQIRLRSSFPPKKLNYIWLKLEDILINEGKI